MHVNVQAPVFDGAPSGGHTAGLQAGPSERFGTRPSHSHPPAAPVPKSRSRAYISEDDSDEEEEQENRQPLGMLPHGAPPNRAQVCVSACLVQGGGQTILERNNHL